MFFGLINRSIKLPKIAYLLDERMFDIVERGHMFKLLAIRIDRTEGICVTLCVLEYLQRLR